MIRSLNKMSVNLEPRGAWVDGQLWDSSQDLARKEVPAAGPDHNGSHLL